MVQTDVAFLLLRLFIGVRLIYGVMDNILSWEHMIEFRNFLELFHFPFPIVSAVASVYAQLIAGMMILLGWKIRWAGAVMVFNFLIALIIVHRRDSFEQMTTPLAILVCSVFFLLAGAGKYALDRKNG